MPDGWIQLTSGGGYDFHKKRIFGPFDVREDIALPLTCPRFTRHTTQPWPVALHCVAVARTILAITGDKRKAAAGLLHDAHEAVIGDITTPVAGFVGREPIAQLKEDVQAAIHLELGIPFDLLPHWHPEIALADAAALTAERMLFMRPTPRKWTYDEAPVRWNQEMHAWVRRFGTESCLEFAADHFLIEWEDLVEPIIKENR